MDKTWRRAAGAATAAILVAWAPIALADHDSEPNDTCSTATLLFASWSGTWSGTTSATDGSDWLSIRGIYPGEEIHLTMTSGTGSHRAAVRENACSASIADILGPVETGTWTLSHSGSGLRLDTETYITTGGTGHGAYTLSYEVHPRDALVHGLEAGDSAATATGLVMSPTTRSTGSLRGTLHDAGDREEWEAGDEDWYSVTVLPGLVRATTNGYQCSFQTIDTDLYKADGTTLLASRPAGCGSADLLCVAAAPTTVVLRVYPGAARGGYGLSVTSEASTPPVGTPLCL